MLQYFAILANKNPLNFELLNLLVKPLMEMSVEIPYFAAICARQRIFFVGGQNHHYQNFIYNVIEALFD